jgi:ribose/xylose/arabinose/galactoside ABC-type transport system permease subunit
MELLRKYRNELGLLAAIALVFGFTLIFNRDYLTEPGRNLRNILHYTSLLGIFSLGAAIVIIAGGIDLSSGSMIVFAASIYALALMSISSACHAIARTSTVFFLFVGDKPDIRMLAGVTVFVAIAAALLVGFFVGTLHTWLITVVRMPPFVATRATLVGLRSLVKVLNPAVTEALGSRSSNLRVEIPAFMWLSEWWVALTVFLAFSALAFVLMNHTVWGRHLYALGGNEDAARLSGIRTNRLKWLAYCIASVTAATAGILYAAKIGSVNPASLGSGEELNAIAAAVVGGCSLRGGVGLIPGVMLGVLFLQMVIDSVNKVIKVGSDDFQGMIVGLLVLLAVAINEFRRQSTGQRSAFFPGALGLLVIPIIGLLVGTILFVTAGLKTGLIAFAVVVVVLGAMMGVQSRAKT